MRTAPRTSYLFRTTLFPFPLLAITIPRSLPGLIARNIFSCAFSPNSVSLSLHSAARNPARGPAVHDVSNDATSFGPARGRPFPAPQASWRLAEFRGLPHLGTRAARRSRSRRRHKINSGRSRHLRPATRTLARRRCSFSSRTSSHPPFRPLRHRWFPVPVHRHRSRRRRSRPASSAPRPHTRRNQRHARRGSSHARFSTPKWFRACRHQAFQHSRHRR